MNLVVRRPNHRLATVNPGLNRMFEDFFNWMPWGEDETTWAPRADIHETQNEYLVQLDLPGMDKKDVKIKVEDDFLVISGERKNEQKVDDEKYHRVERYSGMFSRSFRLYKDVDAGKIKATFKNGVLEITIPKTEETKPKEISIE
jgi:HSP20 family protein